MAAAPVIPEVDKFVQTLTELLDACIIITEELNKNKLTDLSPAIIDTLKTFVLSKDKYHLIDTFINNSSPYWENIRKKDDDFFINESQNIFGEYANYTEFNSLKLIFGKNSAGQPIVDSETKDSVRAYFYALIKISIKYIFESCKPVTKKENRDGKMVTVIKLGSNPFPNVKIIDTAKNWDVKLY